MPSPFEGLLPRYDAVVIGAGLGGMTAANNLAKFGRKVLLLEHHYQLGGLATFFKRAGGHVFDISLHGFPHGMIKSTRRYWTKEISDRIHQLKDVRFINPDFDVRTTFDRADFTRILIEQFRLPAETVEAFFAHLRGMNYYDNDPRTTRQLFEQFFPGRPDVQRLLLEPIAYANGSTLDDPAITFGIVFSNFMSKGVFIFQGGTDVMIGLMTAEMKANGVDIRRNVLVEKVHVEKDASGRRRVVGVKLRGTRLGEEAEVACATVVSNANIKDTVLRIGGEEAFEPAFVEEARKVRVNTSSCQVYMGVREGETIPHIGDLVFTSEARPFSSQELIDFHTTSRTYSVYYPDTRPHTKTPRYAVVTSVNQKWTTGPAFPRLTTPGTRRASSRSPSGGSRSSSPTSGPRSTTPRPRPRAPSTVTSATSAVPPSAPSSRASGSRWPCPSRSAASTMPAASASSCPAGSAPSTTA